MALVRSTHVPRLLGGGEEEEEEEEEEEGGEEGRFIQSKSDE